MKKRFALACWMILWLSGCQSLEGSDAFKTLLVAIRGVKQPTSAGLDPRYVYIRATTGKNVAFLALGYVDPHPHGPIEVWFSADKEVLRFQHGRLVGASGLQTEWRQVRVPALPSWKELANKRAPYHWQRVRDVMPGYQFSISDQLRLMSVAPPASSALLGIAPSSLTWFEESLLLSPSSGPVQALPPARYAVDFSGNAEKVVYGEQCLSADFCLTWQRWIAGQ